MMNSLLPATPLTSEEADESAPHIAEDSSSETEIPELPKPISHSERRRLQEAKFGSWFEAKSESITLKSMNEDMGENDESRSTKYLIEKQEAAVIISDPREYQMELFERAKQQNIIAVLDTGSGKTLIAALLLRHVLNQEHEDRALNNPPRIAFFLVASVTLVFQQAAVLETNLHEKIDRFCGDMGCDLWSKAIWEKHFKENMVIVCTADVLYQCLMHSFISIEQINLLIFDEAHHAKKNHAYAKIIRDFYPEEDDPRRRPKIFGMTASPVDAKVDVYVAARELEILLKSHIATAADLTLLQKSVHRPTEKLIVYKKLEPPFSTKLFQKFSKLFGETQLYRRPFQTALLASSELGSWCSDRVWHYTLSVDGARKLEGTIRRDHGLGIIVARVGGADVLEDNLALVEEAKNYMKKSPMPPPQANLSDLSTKVLNLYNYLCLRYQAPTDDKCIVFVTHRFTARVLEDLFGFIGTPHLRVGALIGARSGEVNDIGSTFRKQVLTLTKFRKGLINCLFATSVAEEGLDIPDCNIVIRFDVFSTLIQYIQSRGRARHANSNYIHMVEENNVRHHSILYEVSDLEDTLRKFCSALPKDRLLTGNDAEDGSSVVKGISPRIYRDPETGATLTYGSSLAILSHFVSCLPHKDEMMLKPRYYVHSRQNQYSSEVVLPENSPIRSAIGHPASQKVLAKQGAAFEMCLQLRRGGHLDSNLLPIYTRRTLPAMRNALLALDLKKTLEYPMRTKPSIWSVAEEKVPAILYLTTLELESPEGLGKPYQPLGVLTRVKLPKFPQFPVHFDAGKLSDVVCSSLELGFGPTEQFIEEITAFTLCVFEDLFNKFYLPDPRTLPYWLVPIRDNIKITTKLHPQNVIQLELITEVFNQENKRRAEAAEWALEVKPKNMNSAPQTPGVEGTSTPSTNTSNPAVADSVSNNREWPHKDKPASFWANRFLVDEFSGGRRLFTIGVVPELKPMDPVPPSCARAKYMDSTILKYSTSVFRNTWAKIEPKLSREQPVILASQVVHRRNWLDKQEEKELKAITQAYVCPEPLKLSPLPTGLVAMGYIFPSIFSRLESYLIAKDCFEVLDLDVDLALALEAITKDSENTGSHDEEAIQFQRGMGKNYERLEFIGDSFLKMATTVSIFTELPEDTEFDYHVHRMVMIANKNLLNRAIEQKIYEYIRSQSFNRRTWYPREPKLLKGKGVIKDMAEGETVETYEEHKHRLGDKTIADVCEAIIGAALLTQNGGKNRFDNAVKAVTRLVKSDHHKAKCWDDYYANYKLPSFATIRTTAAELVVAGKVEEAHPYHFNHPRLLSSAFSHPSYPFSWERIPSYQRLEFLGDALWDMACIDWLFHTNPTRNPQWLTEHKMAMVSNKYQGALSVKLGFHKYLKANHDAVLAGVNDWVKDIQDAEAESQGSPDYWTTVKDPPKCLPDMLEAYIGAIFVDSKYDYKVVEDFFELHILPFFKDLALYDTYANNHPVTFLTEKLVNFYNCTNFRLFSKDIPSTDGSSTKILSAVIIHNEIVSEGVGSTSRYGKLEAAKQALTLLRDTSRAQFMMDYHCDCQKSKTSEGNEKDGVEGKVVAKKAAKKETAVKLASEVKV